MSGWFSQVTGHEAIKRALAGAVAGRRLSGTFLLTGPEGTGRALLARELARALNCRAAAGQPRPCGACGPCGRIARGSSGDYVVLQPEDKASIGIEQVRDFLGELVLAPVEEDGTRVFVIDPASALTEPAQHALLKGLEEPPARAVLVLIAEHPEELLDTVVSRCRQLALHELSPAEVEQVLSQQGAAPDELATRVRWCGGSPGRALSPDAIPLDAAAREVVGGLVTGAAFRDPMALVDTLAGFVDRGGADAPQRRARLLELLRALGGALRDALLLREGPAALERGRLSGAEPDQLQALAALPGQALEEGITHLGRLEDEVRQNVNPTLLLEGLVMDLGQALAPPRLLQAARRDAAGAANRSGR